ncbi:TPA: type IV conjugative transfer system protein TraL [Photobacterium damselae]
MDEHDTFYKIPHYLDQGKLVMGMPMVEVGPGIGVFGLFVMAKYMMAGLVAGLAVFFTMRTLRQGKGENFLPLFLFWYMPESATKACLFPSTPSSDKRYWLN